MIQYDENALICDLAETYGIFDYRSHPPMLIATLSAGLGENSRIKMKMNGAKVPTDTLLLATLVDYAALIWWSKTKDGQKNRNRPTSIVSTLLNSAGENECVAFLSGEDFESARANIINGG